MFNMIGNYSVRKIGDKYYFNASAAGSTPAASQGNVAFQGTASLMVNGQLVSQTPFVYGDGYNVGYPEGFQSIGGLSLQLPTSVTVTIDLSFSYLLEMGSAGNAHSSTMTIPVYVRTIGLPRD